MANPEFGTGKSLVVLAIVVGCFAILWPKIFYPMMQTAFAMTSPKVDSDTMHETDRPPHLHPGSINPRIRNSIANDVEDKFHMREGRPFPHPQARQPVKTPPKSGGAMSIIMPIYTVGIIVFFLYTVLKLVFKKPQEAEKKPLIKDFHMDPQYRKFMCDQPPTKTTTTDDYNSNKVKPKTFEATPENEAKDLDPKDYEIFKLKKKLEETEEAMNRIMKHMGAMSACLTGGDKLPQNENSDVRLRHTGNSKESGKEKSKKDFDNEEDGILTDIKRKILQEDLAKAMLSAAQFSMKSCPEKILNPPSENQDLAESDDDEDDQVESDEAEMNSEEQSESTDEEGASTDEQKINNSCYANGCCKVSYEQPEKVL